MHIKRILIFLFCFTGFFLQCTRSSENEKRVGNLDTNSHPNSLNIPDDEEAADVLLIGRGENLDEFSSVADHFEGMEELFSLGVLKEDSEQLFNRIEDMVVDSRGRLYLLDTRRYGVGVFSREGDYITTLGRDGRGPGEFTNPQTLALYEDSLLIVSNQYRVEVFDITGDMEHMESVSLERESNRICVVGDKLFVHSNQLSNQEDTMSDEEMFSFEMIDAYSIKTFDYLFSFGHSYQHNHPHIAQQLTRGQLTCNETTSMVVFTFDMMPFIQGYSAEDGGLKWRNRMDNLNSPKITERYRNGRLGLSFGRAEGTVTDVLTAPVTLQDKYMAVQVSRSTRYETENGTVPETEQIFHTFLLDSSTGRGNYLGDDIPFISAISDNILASRDYSLDYPVARIFELNGE